MVLVEDESGSLRRMIHPLDHIMENVRLAAHRSNPYKEAVSFCATAHFPQIYGDTEMEELLANFYWSAVYP